jgi:hypothetical protein
MGPNGGRRPHRLRREHLRRRAHARLDLFLYLVLDRTKANLALARHNLRRIESDLSV